jgi:hypothetical protein
MGTILLVLYLLTQLTRHKMPDSSLSVPLTQYLDWATRCACSPAALDKAGDHPGFRSFFWLVVLQGGICVTSGRAGQGLSDDLLAGNCFE